MSTFIITPREGEKETIEADSFSEALRIVLNNPHLTGATIEKDWSKEEPNE